MIALRFLPLLLLASLATSTAAEGPTQKTDWRYLGRGPDGIIFIDPANYEFSKGTTLNPDSAVSITYRGLFIQRKIVKYDVPEPVYSSHVLYVEVDCDYRTTSVVDLSLDWSNFREMPYISTKDSKKAFELSGDDRSYGAAFSSACNKTFLKRDRITYPNKVGVAMLRYGAKTLAELPPYVMTGVKYDMEHGGDDELPGNKPGEYHVHMGLVL